MAYGSREVKPKRVLFLIDRFPYNVGGAERTLLKITRLLPPNRYQCSVVTFAIDPRFGDPRQLFSCPFQVLPIRRIYGWSGLRAAMTIADLIRSQKVSIVHTFFSTSDLWGGIIAKLSGCPVLVSSRRDMGFDRSLKHRLAYRWLGGMFDQVQAVSEEVRSSSISNDGLKPNRVVTILNGVDLEEVQNVNGLTRSDGILDVQQASHFIVTVGNVRPVKGIDVLLHTAARVCRKFPRAVFLIVGWVGDQAYYRGLQELIRSLGLARNVKFLGLRDEVVSILKICDVFFLPSRSEGLSNALLEAMACKLPCVATAVGGNPEVVEDGRSGFLIPSENAELAADRITTLLADPKSAREMGEVGRSIVERKFTVQRMMDQLVRCYDSLLEQKIT